MKTKYLNFCAAIFALCLMSNAVYAQCGLPGTPPCPASKTSPVSKPVAREIAAKQRAVREIAEREKAEQVRIARARLKLKQLAKKRSDSILERLKLDSQNVAGYQQRLKKAKPFDLFPVADVTLGKTESIYLSLRGNECGIKDDAGKMTECYELDGIYFYCDENKVSDKLYFSTLRLDGMPPHWKKAGFDWNLSFNEWKKLFETRGYYTVSFEEPKVVSESGERFLKGDLWTIIKTPDGNVAIGLNFNFGAGKTTLDDRGTLFSIEADILK